jgi:hypothetical protein
MLRPTWDSVKKAMGSNSGITFREVEYSEFYKLPKALQNVSGFPAIQVVENNKVIAEYSGDRTELSIMAFAKKYAVKPVARSLPVSPVAKPKTATASSKAVARSAPAVAMRTRSATASTAATAAKRSTSTSTSPAKKRTKKSS